MPPCQVPATREDRRAMPLRCMAAPFACDGCAAGATRLGHRDRAEKGSGATRCRHLYRPAMIAREIETQFAELRQLCSKIFCPQGRFAARLLLRTIPESF